MIELTNAAGLNRRDLIFPNYATDGFWHFVRERYAAEHIVVDAKNYVEGVEKAEVLQVANYLSAHGAGLFGLIVARRPAKASAIQTAREQWISYRKLILLISDEDVEQMLSNHQAGQETASVIRQLIEDFRLSF